jgi:hypothetical protein
MRRCNIIVAAKYRGLSAKALRERYYHRKSRVCELVRRIPFDTDDLMPGSREINLICGSPKRGSYPATTEALIKPNGTHEYNLGARLSWKKEVAGEGLSE